MTVVAYRSNRLSSQTLDFLEDISSNQPMRPKLNTPRELTRCSVDVVYFVRHYCYTFDPRLPESIIPFDPFPRQEEFFHWLEESDRLEEGGIVEKSRDMGVTWCCCAYALWCWLFKRGDATGFGSRKLELVDKLGDPDSIFEKIRFMLRYLPDWMRPRGFGERHMGSGKILNPENGSIISGEGGDQIGRGGRKRRYFVDESAFLEHPKLVDASLFQNTNVRIDVSTPNGPGNPFATKRNSGVWRVFRFHWRDDPRKDDAWYEAVKRTMDPVIVAQEVDIDFNASIEGICIPGMWVQSAVDFLSDPPGHLIAGYDVADEGSNRNVMVFRRGPKVMEVVSWGQMLTTESAYKAADEMRNRRAHTMYYDNIGVGTATKGIYDSMVRTDMNNHVRSTLGFNPVGVNGGGPPSEDLWPDGRTSKEMFFNKRAEIWWKLRRRFEKTHEYVEKGIDHPLDECISIPNNPDLIRDLSLPLVFRTDTGKIQIESKIMMAKRGVKSPDFGDGCAYSFAGDAAADWAEFAELLRSTPPPVSAFAGMEIG